MTTYSRLHIKIKFRNIKILYKLWTSPRLDIIIEIDENILHPGDFLTISQIDRRGLIIIIGTRGHIGHSAACF